MHDQKLLSHGAPGEGKTSLNSNSYSGSYEE